MTTAIPVAEVREAKASAPQWLVAAWGNIAEVREVAVEGALVRYRGWGLDNLEKPGLIFVHGFRAHARWWDHIAPYFTAHYRVIAPDLTGMGDSERRKGYSRRQFSREIIAVADDAGFVRPTIVAHSFGAVVAMYACKSVPDRIRRAIIIDNRVFADDFEAPPIPFVPERFYPDIRDAQRRFRLMPPGKWPDPYVFDYIARHSLRQTPLGWTWKFDREATTLAETGLFQNEIRDITVPLDFIYGKHSELVGPPEVAAMLRNMPTCGRPISIPASHHHVMIEQPLALITALDGLLANDRS